MDALYFLIGCSIFIALLFLAAFLWANKTGQHKDTQTPAMRILFDDELTNPEEESESTKK